MTDATTDGGPELRPLTNDGWGFESNCFVCEPRNVAGLRIPFHHDVSQERVVAIFDLDARFSGAPQYVHGGVTLAILDEAMAWAAIAIGKKFAVTRETSTTFERPVKVDREHRVHAWLTDLGERSIRAEAEIVRTDGKRCATSAATFTVLGIDQATDAVGERVSGEAATYTADPSAGGGSPS